MARHRARTTLASTAVGTAAKGSEGQPRFRLIVLAITAILLLGWFSPASSDSDTWWALKSGQYIAQHHSLPLPDPFSFTTYLGNPPANEAALRDYNLKFEWLAELLLYGIYALAGFPGLVLFRAAILVIFSATSGAIVYRRSGGWYRALAATLLTAFVAGVFTSDRPYQVTYLFLAATLLILEFRRAIWLLPPMFLIWANCHGGYILGFVILGAYLAESVPAATRDRLLWLIAPACFLASGVNPNGFRGLTILLSYRQSGMIQSLFEWQKVPFWPPTFVELVLAAGVILLVWQRARTRIPDWLLLIAFGAAYFSAVRNTPIAGLIAATVVFSYVPWKVTIPDLAAWPIAGLLMAGIVACVVQGRAFQLHDTAWKYPAGAADFLLTHKVTGPMLNSWEDGGYLQWRLWPQQRVFIDGRALNESVFRDYQRMVQYSPPKGGPSGQSLLEKYGIQVILLNGFEINSGDPYMLPVVLAVSGQTEWKLVYLDAQATIFMRDPPAGVSPLPPRTALDNLESQCGVILANDSAQPGCARGLSRLFTRIGDLPRARGWMGRYQSHR